MKQLTINNFLIRFYVTIFFVIINSLSSTCLSSTDLNPQDQSVHCEPLFEIISSNAIQKFSEKLDATQVDDYKKRILLAVIFQSISDCTIKGASIREELGQKYREKFNESPSETILKQPAVLY